MADERNGAQFLVPNCRTLRVAAGKRIAQLSAIAGIGRDTIGRKVEKGQPVTEPVAHALFNALNQWHQGTLDRKKEVLQVRKGE